MNKVSVCIATYNGELFIREQLESIIGQLSLGDEIVISDDGSIDDTVSQIESLDSPFIRLVNVSRVGGVVKNFECSLSYAKNDLIVLSDQDDVWLPGRVELIKQKLIHNDLILLNGKVVSENLSDKNITIFESVDVRKGFFNNLLKNSYVGCCMAFKRTLLERALPFPSSVIWHDWYLGLIGESKYGVEHVPEETILFRRHGNNASQTGSRSGNSIFKMLLMRLKMIISLSYYFCRK